MPTPQQEALMPTPHPDTRHHILIVEDEAIVALDLRLHLEELGYVVDGVAASAQAAHGFVERRTPDLILMDVHLQGEVDGIEVAGAIRRTRDVPVIFLTAHSDDQTVMRAAGTAPYGYLTKPYQLRELRAGVEVALTKARMERRLREADRWFSSTLQCVSDGVVVTESDGKIRFMNPVAERLSGWTMDEAVGQSVDHVVHVGQTPRAAALRQTPGDMLQSVIARGRPSPAVHALTMMSRQGVACWVDLTAAPVDDDAGVHMGAVLVLRDATARMAQEALLRQSEERFRKAFDHAPLGMVLVSLGGEFLQINRAFSSLLRGTADEIKAHNHAELATEADREHEASRLADLSASDAGVVQYERQYRRLDGSPPVSTLVSASIMREDEVATCYLLQVHDLTQQKLAAQQLAELAQERLRSQASEVASAAKSEFLSRASHEMRTPLNAVIGFAQLLELFKGTNPAKTAEYASHIRVAGEHMLTLVNDLLDLNRSAQGTLKIEKRPVPVRAAINEALQILSMLGATHGIEVLAESVDDLVVSADPTRLRQVLLNVGSNAIKYNRQGGQVRISVHGDDRQRARICIADSGIGMTAEQLDRLFQPFNRLGLERTQIPGVGLGLVIARSLMVEMGGDLVVESLPRQGTTVALSLELG
jgi:PAS domain S-box-containing protein